MNPLRLNSLPADPLKGLRELTLVTEHLAAIAARAEELPAIRSAIQAVKHDTTALGPLSHQMATMDNRMASIEDAMPVLVEVQQNLTRMPEAIESLQSGIDRLCGLMGSLLMSVDRLDTDVGSLAQSLEPVARVADKLPGGRKR